jgi:hypothetical protein
VSRAPIHVAQDLLPRLVDSPQPIALAVGRVVRAVGNAERLEACLKAAEVVARYVAVVSLASAASTRPAGDLPPTVGGFEGNLSFGSFETAARASGSVAWEHPLRGKLRACLQKRKAVVGQQLQAFVQLRNELGHALTPVDDARARALLETHDPVGGLMMMLEGLESIIGCPLLVVFTQEHRLGRVVARVGFFTGEGEPIPQELELEDPIFDWEMPYLCTPDGLIPLTPGLLYEPRSTDGRFGLFLLDAINSGELRYKSVIDNSSITRPNGVEIANWVQPLDGSEPLALDRPRLETISCLDGRTLHDYLSGAAPPDLSRGRETQKGDAGQVEVVAPRSVAEFERRANGLGLGGAFRDILYHFATLDARASIHGETLRFETTDKPERVLATVELTADGFSVVLLLGSLTDGQAEETERHGFRAGMTADALITRLVDLAGGKGVQP